MSDDALDYPARQGEEAIRQLDMLRHTLKERMAAVLRKAESSRNEDDEFICGVEYATYRDVLTLLGPEPGRQIIGGVK